MVRTIERERRQLDPVKTRSDILEAARLLFAERGFSGTSIADIARRADVPKSLVQYHFGSKGDLWQASVRHRAAPMIVEMDRFLGGEGTAEDLLKARIRLHREHPDLGRLLAWVSIEPAPFPEFIQERRQALAGKVLHQGGPSRVLGVLSAIAWIDGWFLFRNLYKRLASEELLESMSDEMLMRNAIAMVAEP